jgi:hypothetical protein
MTACTLPVTSVTPGSECHSPYWGDVVEHRAAMGVHGEALGGGLQEEVADDVAEGLARARDGRDVHEGLRDRVHMHSLETLET